MKSYIPVMGLPVMAAITPLSQPTSISTPAAKPPDNSRSRPPQYNPGSYSSLLPRAAPEYNPARYYGVPPPPPPPSQRQVQDPAPSVPLSFANNFWGREDKVPSPILYMGSGDTWNPPNGYVSSPFVKDTPPARMPEKMSTQTSEAVAARASTWASRRRMSRIESQKQTAPEPKQVVISVDYGTTYTGFAYSATPTPMDRPSSGRPSVHFGQTASPLVMNKLQLELDVTRPRRNLDDDNGDPGILRPYRCTACDQSFTMNTSLMRHRREAHRDSPSSYPCTHPGCDRSFTRISSRIIHNRIAHRPDRGEEVQTAPTLTNRVPGDAGDRADYFYERKHKPDYGRDYYADRSQRLDRSGYDDRESRRERRDYDRSHELGLLKAALDGTRDTRTRRSSFDRAGRTQQPIVVSGLSASLPSDRKRVSWLRDTRPIVSVPRRLAPSALHADDARYLISVIEPKPPVDWVRIRRQIQQHIDAFKLAYSLDNILVESRNVGDSGTQLDTANQQTHEDSGRRPMVSTVDDHGLDSSMSLYLGTLLHMGADDLGRELLWPSGSSLDCTTQEPRNVFDMTDHLAMPPLAAVLVLAFMKALGTVLLGPDGDLGLSTTYPGLSMEIKDEPADRGWAQTSVACC